MKWFIIVLILIELWYWLRYFPRAWKEGSNREIEDIKHAIKYLKGEEL